MAIKLNGTEITANRIGSLHVTEEKLDNEKVYPSVMTMGMIMNSGAIQTINLIPTLNNGRQCVILTFNDPVFSIIGVEASGNTINVFPGNSVSIINNGFFTGVYLLDPGMNDMSGNIGLGVLDFVVYESYAFFSNAGAYLPNDVWAIMLTVD